MKVLLDTHTFLWWNANSQRLSSKARDIILSGRADIYLSSASAWEIALKALKGRLILNASPEQYIIDRLAYYHFLPLPIQISHACHSSSLPRHHNDPFDRLLIAQCQLEGMSILSTDEMIRKYDLDVIW